MLAHRPTIPFLMTATLLVVAACSSGSGGTQPGQTPTISIGLSPTSATIGQGASTAVTATVTRGGGYTGTISIAVQGAPSGVTGSASSPQTSGTTTTTTVTVTASGSAAPGTYPLTVQASGSGVTTASASFSLTITAAGGYTLSAQPTSVSIAQGANGTSAITIARTGGFTGSVALAVSGAPAGLTASLNPTSTTGTTSTLTVAATANLATGTYPLTVTGSATGLANQTATVGVTVTTGSGGGGNATVDVSGCAPKPVWFAYQDGNGPWSVLAVPANSMVQFSINGATGGYAFVIETSATTPQLQVHFMTRAELTGSTVIACPTVPIGGASANGTVAGLSAGDFALVSMGGAITTAAANGLFSLTGVAVGQRDLIGWRHPFTGSNPDRGLVRRDVNVPSGPSSVGTVDFGGSESFAPATAIITVSNVMGAEQVTHSMNYWTTAACHTAGMYTTTSGPQSGFTAYGFPPAIQRPTDFHQLTVLAQSGTTPATGYAEYRVASVAFNALADRSVTLPSPIDTPVVTDLSTAYKRMAVTFPFGSDFTIGATFEYYNATSPIRFAFITATTAWIGGSTATITMPDFHGLSGWNDAWAPATGVAGSWSAIGSGMSAGFSTLCHENASFGTTTYSSSY